MGYRIAVLPHQGFIPNYRERLFEELNSSTGNEYVVFHSDPPLDSGYLPLPGPLAFPNVKVRRWELPVGQNTAVFQTVLRPVLGVHFDALVVAHEVKFVANMTLFAAFKAVQKPAILWGWGLHRANASWPARRSSRTLARSADAYLVYTTSGGAELEAASVSRDRIFVLRNTLDIVPYHRAKQRLDGMDCEAIKDQLNIPRDAQVLLYIGRLTRRKAVDVLIEVARSLNDDPSVGSIEVLVAGDGPERPVLEARAATLPNLRFLGPVYDPDAVAKLMKISIAVLQPGAAGLAINHAFAFGKPVVTRQNPLHPPEISYIEPGRNGIITGPDVDSLVHELACLLKDKNRQERLAAGALATSDMLGLDHTVQQFDCGVRYAIACKVRFGAL
jgi:glycosyltransferase involved in cell wall biosynthesis